MTFKIGAKFMLPMVIAEYSELSIAAYLLAS